MKNNKHRYQRLGYAIVLTALVTGCAQQHIPEAKITTDKSQSVTDQFVITEQLSAPATANKTRPQPVEEQARELARTAQHAKSEQQYRQKEKRSLRPMHGSITPFIQSSIQYNDYASGNIQDKEKYAKYVKNLVKQTAIEPLSTFSIDVDTGSYSNVRRLINSGTLPLKDAVRVEEMLNYFSYDYKNTPENNAPFISRTETAPSPWSKHHHLLQIGIKAIDIEARQLPAANLVFLIDVSGSMASENKLGLLKKSLGLLVSKMRKQDTISLVVYAGASGIVLEPTSGDQKSLINNALSRLRAGGSTNGASGIQLAYQVAQQAYIKNGINRILLATDGDFNVGTVNFNQLIELVEEKRKTGISLSTLGFGHGNYNDQLMEQLADSANGKYSYIDTLKEAQKVLIDEMSSSLKTVAKDVKIQIEFNPSVVAEYRLIGYENRRLNEEDFNNDNVDAGEIGAGHTVTAFYEIVLSSSQYRQIDPLRYQQESADNVTNSNELAFVKIRYKEPQHDVSKLITQAVPVSAIRRTIEQTSDDFRFASSVIGFAELLKDEQQHKEIDFDQVIKLSTAARGKDLFGYRSEFTQLVKLAQSLKFTALQQ
ncbi:MAG: VWA domain-containing protein [Gammaproteobacteria bacterium]|nr:VWA domain-containing protein [Gammaproteobacteria bacterium]